MNIITTQDALREFVEHYQGVEVFAFDVETIGDKRGNPIVNDVCWISFATNDRVDVIPMGHPNGDFDRWDKPLLLSGERRLAEGKELLESSYSKDEKKWKPVFTEPPVQLTPAEVFRAIQPLMFSDKLKIGHNIKFDLKSIAKYYHGAVPKKPYFDTMMAAFIVNNLNRHKLGLDDCAERELGVKVQKGVGANVALHSFDEVAKYAAIDADITYKLYKHYDAKLTDGLRRVWKLEMDVVFALCGMELAGAFMDEVALKELSARIEIDKVKAEAACYKAAGKAFPLNSVPEKQRLLFTSQDGKRPRITVNTKIKVALTPKGQQALIDGQAIDHTHCSVSADALEFYRGKDDLVDAILEYQDLNKLMTTYVTPYTGGMVKRVTNGKEKIVAKESLLIKGRVHTDFKAHGAETGRFSSTEPNLQNIPSSGDYGKLVRNLFVAPKGYKLVVADYSQIEPRVMASLSNDPVLVDNYMTGKDIYTTIGDTMGVDRKAGKVLVLAISYGVGPDKIATSIGCSVQQAKKLLADFETQFSAITRYKGKVIRLAKQSGPIPYVETIFGRRRYIPELKITNAYDKGLLARAERQAFNTMIQGSAADIMKLALVRAHSCFVNEPDINVILTVHDELVTITPEDRAEETAQAIRESMEGIRLRQITVPLIAEVNIVDKWGQAK